MVRLDPIVPSAVTTSSAVSPNFSTLYELEDEANSSSNHQNNHNQGLTNRRSSIYLTVSHQEPPTSDSSSQSDRGWVIERVRPDSSQEDRSNLDNLVSENDEIEVSFTSHPMKSTSPSHASYSRRASVVSPTPVINNIPNNNTQSVVSTSEGIISSFSSPSSSSKTITSPNMMVVNQNELINTMVVPTNFSIESNVGSIINGNSMMNNSIEVTQVSVKKKPHLKDISNSDKDHRQSFYIYHYDYRPSESGDGKAISTSIRNIKKKNQIEEKPIDDSAFKSFFVKAHQSMDKEKVLETLQNIQKNSGNSMMAEVGSKQDLDSPQEIPNTKTSTSNIPRQESKLPFLISLKLTFAFLISILIVFACVGIFVSVFAPLYVSIDELTLKNVQTIHKQISIHLDKILGSLKSTSLLGADNYNSGFITRPMYREYLLSAYRRTGVFVGYFFSNPSLSERFSYTVMSPGNNLYFTRQEDGFPGIIRDRVDINGTVLQYNATVDYTPANLTKTDFYVNTLTNIAKLKTEGVFSSPFYIINGSIALPYATLLYDPVVLKNTGSKVVQGICRCTIPLILFSEFLKEVKILDQGYTILTEMSGPSTIAGSIKTTSADGKKALSVFELTDRNAGALMKAIASTYDFYNLPSVFSINSEGISYLISVSSYTNENIAWRQFIIVYSDDISKTAHNSIIASVCVAFGILVFSILYGLLIGRIAIGPILFLEKQLALIQVFDLASVKRNSSIFIETESIYQSLAATVRCLSEIKSFLPQTVVSQLEEIEKEGKQLAETNTRKSMYNNHSINTPENKYSIDTKSTTFSFVNESLSFKRVNSRNSNLIKRQSSSLLSNNNSMFRMGLSKKECSVLNITLPQYTDMHTPEEIATTFPKIISVIRNAAQQFQANLQVNSISEYVLVFDAGKQNKHIAVTAMECALKVKRGLQGLNTQQDMSPEKVESFTFSMGISTNENCYVGNLGTRSFRYFSIVSESTVIAKNLSFLANQLKVNIIVDEPTFKESSKYFIARPVERVLFRTIKKQILDNDAEYLKSQLTTIDTVSSVYELIRESAIEENEWMYELQNQNENLRIQRYHSIFDIFKSDISNETFVELLDEKISDLKEYLLVDPNDFPSKNLLELYEKFQANRTSNVQSFRNTISTYCISIDKSITTHLLLEELDSAIEED